MSGGSSGPCEVSMYSSEWRPVGAVRGGGVKAVRAVEAEGVWACGWRPVRTFLCTAVSGGGSGHALELSIYSSEWSSGGGEGGGGGGGLGTHWRLVRTFYSIYTGRAGWGRPVTTFYLQQ